MRPDDRHSLDVIASSTYDAAHLYVTHAKVQPPAGLPVPTLATIFEIVNGGKVYTVEGDALQRWIEQRRQEWEGSEGTVVRLTGRHCFSLTTKRYDRCQDEISLDD